MGRRNDWTTTQGVNAIRSSSTSIPEPPYRHQCRARMRGWALAAVAVLGCLTMIISNVRAADSVAGAGPGVLPNLEGIVHEPYVEWRVEVAEVGAIDPWDVRAFATFTHRDRGTVYRVPWFYAGDGVFALRFTGPSVGVYDVRSSSADAAALDGLSATVTIGANPDPDAKGYLTSDGDAFAYLVGDGTEKRRTLYNVFQRHTDAREPTGWETVAHVPIDTDRPFDGLASRIEEMLDEVELHGMQALLLMIAHNSTSFPSAYDTAYREGRETPDQTTYAIVEEVLTRAHARGLFVHFWLWSDSEVGGSSESLPGGINGWLDRRLNEYFLARLGAYPNWSMSLGYDLEEWIDEEQVREWGTIMRSASTLPRLYMAREHGTHWRFGTLDLGGDKLDVYSNDFRPSEGFHVHARDRFDEVADRMPVMYERRFLHTRDDVWDMTTTRRAIWQFTLAGGAGGIYGTLWGPGPDYPDPAQLSTIARFWEPRFRHALRPNPDPIDGLVMHDDHERLVVYTEDASTVAIEIASGATNVRVVAVDTTRAYEELEVGTFDGGTHVVDLPRHSDWALAIGTFGHP